MDKQFCVYILASKRDGTLYIGVTAELAARVWQHKSKAVEGFTAEYGVDKLVYYETHGAADVGFHEQGTPDRRIFHEHAPL